MHICIFNFNLNYAAHYASFDGRSALIERLINEKWPTYAAIFIAINLLILHPFSGFLDLNELRLLLSFPIKTNMFNQAEERNK